MLGWKSERRMRVVTFIADGACFTLQTSLKTMPSSAYYGRFNVSKSIIGNKNPNLILFKTSGALPSSAHMPFSIIPSCLYTAPNAMSVFMIIRWRPAIRVCRPYWQILIRRCTAINSLVKRL